MASVKIVLRKKKNKDGTFPLAIRITKDRKASYIHLGHHIANAEWDETGQKVKKSHPNHARLNNLLLKKRAEVNDTLLDLETHNTDVSSKGIKKHIKPKGGTSFFSQADIFTENLRLNGKYNRYNTDIGRIKRFREFVKGDITFQEITVNLLNKFRAHLKSTYNIKERTIVNYLLLIRTIYNQAIKSNVTDNTQYPFGKGKIVIKFPDSIKIGLTSEEVKLLENAQLSGYQDHARNVWLISFYFAGMRLADVMKLKWSDLKDNRLHYAMTKNQKVGSLQIPEKALAILERYKSDAPKHDFIFPELKVLDILDPYEVQRKISYAGKRLDKTLKEIAKAERINKNISMHIARHSFAQIAGDKVSVQILQRLYRHSSITTTIGYQSHFSNKDTDNALGAVIDF